MASIRIPDWAADALTTKELPRDDAIWALEYACTIDADHRRGVWVKAFVEEKEWAIRDFNEWRSKR